MKAEEYRGAFGSFLALRVDERYGLVAMFRRGAGDPYGINAQRLPLILDYLKERLEKSPDGCGRLEREDAELALVEIKKAAAAVAAHPS